MSRRFLALAFLATATLTVPTVARAETKISAYLGKSFTNNSDLRIRQPNSGSDVTYEGVPWDDESFAHPLYYGFKITHFLKNSPWLGVSVDFFHFKVYADTDARVHARGIEGGISIDRDQLLGRSIQRFSISHGVNYLTGNVLGRLQLRKSEAYPHGRIQPYAGLGLGGLLLHPESQIKGKYFERYEWDGIGPQFFAGIDYCVTPKWSVFAEYKYTTRRVEVGTARGGTGSTDLDTHHLAFGISYRL